MKRQVKMGGTTEAITFRPSEQETVLAGGRFFCCISLEILKFWKEDD